MVDITTRTLYMVDRPQLLKGVYQCAVLATTPLNALTALHVAIESKKTRNLDKQALARKLTGACVTMLEECNKGLDAPGCSSAKQEVFASAKWVFGAVLQDVSALSSHSRSIS